MMRYAFVGFCVLALLAGCGKNDDALMTTAEQQAAHAQWPEAMETYRGVIARHPDGPRTAEALYRSGMIQYSQLKDFRGGAAKFEEVANRFPKSAEAPKALMVLGFMYAEELPLRNLDSARAVYGRLVAQYPGHELAAGARLQMQHLGESPESVISGAPPADAPIPHAYGDSLSRSPSARALAH